MLLGKGSGDKQPNADEVNTDRRSVQHSPVVLDVRRCLTEVKLSTTATPSATLASVSPTATSAAVHETKHTTNSQLQVPSANLPAFRDEASLSLIFQKQQSTIIQ